MIETQKAPDSQKTPLGEKQKQWLRDHIARANFRNPDQLFVIRKNQQAGAS